MKTYSVVLLILLLNGSCGDETTLDPMIKFVMDSLFKEGVDTVSKNDVLRCLSSWYDIIKLQNQELITKLIKMKNEEIALKEKKSDKFKNATVELEAQVKNYAKVLRIIGTRSKVEGMVEKLYPLRKNPKTGEQIFGKPASSYCDALHEMLTSNDIRFTQDPFICMVRQRLIDNNVPVSVFMKFIRWLYSQFSDKAYHKMAQFSPPLPHYDDVKGIKEMLECIDVDQDVPALICLQILLQPLDMPSIVSVSTTPSASVSVTTSTAKRGE